MDPMQHFHVGAMPQNQNAAMLAYGEHPHEYMYSGNQPRSTSSRPSISSIAPACDQTMDRPSSPPLGYNSQQCHEYEKSKRAEYRRQPPIVYTDGPFVYGLKIVQEPNRARMCGYGDKDRRPITGPPILRLVIKSANTLQEIDYNDDNLDPNSFIVKADLCSPDGQSEVNILRPNGLQDTITPSLQTDSRWARPPVALRSAVKPGRIRNSMPAHKSIYNPIQPSTPVPALYHPASAYGLAPGQTAWNTPPLAMSLPVDPYNQNHNSQPWLAMPPIGSYHELKSAVAASDDCVARQLVGNTVVNGQLFPWLDYERSGIFFVFNDLSIRQDLWFTLRFSLFQCAGPTEIIRQEQLLQVNGGETRAKLFPQQDITPPNQNAAPLVAKVWSQPFKVYQAKRFPGVVKSGLISEHFAHLGCKISIRKEGKKKRASKKRARSEDSSSEGGEGDDAVAYDSDDEDLVRIKDKF